VLGGMNLQLGVMIYGVGMMFGISCHEMWDVLGCSGLWYSVYTIDMRICDEV